MPETRFQIQWPDGTEELCYSPSLVIKKYLSPDTHYDLADFVARSREALHIASDRVQAKYGFPCGKALGQLQRIEVQAQRYQHINTPEVKVIAFLDEEMLGE